jgi:hypothetical protein
MSNQKQLRPAKPLGMSRGPSLYTEQWEYAVNGNMIDLRFGRDGRTDAAVTLPLNTFLDLMNKVQETVINMTRNAQQQEEPSNDV